MGIEVVIATSETNEIVQLRAKKLKIEALRGLDNKADALSDYLANRSITWGDVWYIGNDVNDLESLAKAGISFCPLDASPEVFLVSKVVLSRRGGEGVLAEIASRLENLENEH